jgi:hypothetical protein
MFLTFRIYLLWPLWVVEQVSVAVKLRTCIRKVRVCCSSLCCLKDILSDISVGLLFLSGLMPRSLFTINLSSSFHFNLMLYKLNRFWYSDYGVQTVVSLNCGRFYGSFVRPRMRWMCERMNEWKWVSERTISFLISEMWSLRWNMMLKGEIRRTWRETCLSATLSTANPTKWTRARTRAAAVRGRRLFPPEPWHGQLSR